MKCKSRDLEFNCLLGIITEEIEQPSERELSLLKKEIESHISEVTNDNGVVTAPHFITESQFFRIYSLIKQTGLPVSLLDNYALGIEDQKLLSKISKLDLKPELKEILVNKSKIRSLF